MVKKYITEQQVKLYMKYRQNKKGTQEACAAKAGFSTRVAYAIEQGKHHTQRPKKLRDYKTRSSPIDHIWDQELVQLLQENSTLQPKTLLIYLQRKYVDEAGMPLYDESILRTLQRRVAHWQAQNGAPKEVIFPQIHLPGQQALSDFTWMDRCEITIQGKPFKHMLYHFRLAYSKWSYLKVIQGGESFQALSEGLQESLFQLGGTPKEHRTDSLSAAFKNLTAEAQKDVTQQYHNLCAHYGMIPTRNNKGVSHENGSVESAHGHLKNRIAQELLLRKSYDFESIAAYEKWLQDVVVHHNKRHRQAFLIEKNALQPLPPQKSMDYELLSVKVSSLSLIHVRGIRYSVPSRLVGHALTLHLYQHRIIGYLGSAQVIELERKYRNTKTSHYVIDYRHLIHALIKKPNAFRFCQYRNEILPNSTYQAIWAYLEKTEPKEIASKTMLRLLKLAADYQCEEKLGQHVSSLIQAQLPIQIQVIERDFNGSNPPLPASNTQQHTLSNYDRYIPTTGEFIHATL